MAVHAPDQRGVVPSGGGGGNGASTNAPRNGYGYPNPFSPRKKEGFQTAEQRRAKQAAFEAEEMMRGLSDKHAEMVKTFVSKLKGAASKPDGGDIKLELWCLPEEVRTALEAFDYDATGQVSANDLQDAAGMLRAMRFDSEIKIEHLPVHTRQFLECFDADGDGTLATPELAEAARLYRDSKLQGRRLLRVLAAVAIAFAVLVATMGGVTAAVVEALKEIEAHPSTGLVTVAGGSVVAAVANPHFRTGPAAASMQAMADATASAAVGDRAPVVRSALVDPSGFTVSTAPLTAPDRGMVDAGGNYVRVETKTFEDVFAGDALVELLDADRDALASLETLETADANGRAVTLTVTGHAYRALHFVRAGDAPGAPLYVPAKQSAVSGGVSYDLAMRLLVLHSADTRVPAAVAVTFEPLSARERAFTPAKNVSAALVVGDAASERALAGALRVAYATDEALNTSDVPFGPIAPGWIDRPRPACDWVCTVKDELYVNGTHTGRATYWKSRSGSPMRRSTGGVKTLADLARDAQRIEKNIVTITSRVGEAKSHVESLPARLHAEITSKLAPLANLTGCAIATEASGFLNAQLGGDGPAKLAIGSTCAAAGVKVNSGKEERVFASPAGTFTVDAKTDVAATLQLHGIELDCEGLDAAMAEFWALNPLADFVKSAIDSNAVIKQVNELLAQAQHVITTTNWRTAAKRRRRHALSEEGGGEEGGGADVDVRVDVDALARHASEDATRAVAERLAAFARGRRLAENPAALFKVKSLRARVTLDAATAVHLRATQASSHAEDLLDGTASGTFRFDASIPVPGTLGLVTVGLGAELSLGLPLEVSTESATPGATVTLRLEGVALDTAVVVGGAAVAAVSDGPDEYAAAGSADGSAVSLTGVGASASVALAVRIRTVAVPSLCFAGVCGAVAIDARMETKMGADAALSHAVPTSDTLGWAMRAKHSPHAAYSTAQKAAYNAAYSSSGDNAGSPGNGWVVGGGGWSYATLPRVRAYPSTSGGSCGAAAESARMFQYRPSGHRWDQYDATAASMTTPHPDGGYLFRRSFSHAAPTGPAPGSSAETAERTFSIAYPVLRTPSTWDGATFPKTTAAGGSTTGRKLAAVDGAAVRVTGDGSSRDALAGLSRTGVACGEGNGGHEGSDLRGSVPSAGVRCGGGAGEGGGAAREWRGMPLCWSEDCCWGFAVKSSWSRWQCVPASAAALIPK